MTAGLTPTGFVAKTVEELRAELEGDLRASLGTDLDTSAESVVGQLIASQATKLRELWELAEILYNARVPGGASFASLTELARLTGTERRAATKGTVTLMVTLTAGTTLAAGAVAAVAGQPSNRWVTLVAVSNPGPRTNVVPVPAEAETAGPIRANVTTITTIATPAAGWLAVTNAADAAPGLATETDSELRIRRDQELSRPGTATVPAIRADLLNLSKGVATFANLSGPELALVRDSILSVIVETNRSAYPDALGRPGHTVEAVVQWRRGLPGGALALLRAIFALQLYWSTPVGIGWYGALSGTITNPNAQTETVRWSEALDVNVYCDVTLAVDSSAFGDSATGEARVKSALVEFGGALTLGQDVVRSRLYPTLLAVPGVLDVLEVRLGRTALTLSQNLAIGPRESALFDTARITVTTTTP